MRTMDVGGVSLYDNIVIDKLKQKKQKMQIEESFTRISI